MELWKKSEMRYKWKKYDWWIYCVIIAIAVFLILYYCYPDTEQDKARYILSAISQGLAAILALVFTITLVVSQMTRRYTAMDKIIFRFETIFLMIVFGIGVVTPLLVLKFGFWEGGVILSIVIASFCVFSLLPFLKGVNGVLKYEIGIVNLNEEIIEAIMLGYEPTAKNKIMQLNDIGRSAITDYCEDVISSIISFLGQIGEKSFEKRFVDATFFVIEGLRDLGYGGADKGFEDVKVLFAALELGTLRTKAIENQWEDIAMLSTTSLKSIGVKAAEKNLPATTSRSIGGLRYVRTEGEMSNNIEFLTVDALWCLGAAVQKYQPTKVDYVTKHLREMETEAHLDRSMVIDWGKDAVNDYPELKSSFEEFKRRYEEG